MSNKKSKKFVNAGILMAIVISILAVSVSSAVASETRIVMKKNVFTEDAGNVSARIFGGIGYIVMIKNNRDVPITAELYINSTPFFTNGSFENTSSFDIPSGHSVILYRVGLPTAFSFFSHVNISVSVDEEVIAEKSGTSFMGLILIFTNPVEATE